MLFEDETILRLFPPLRSAWAKQGQQAEVPISGANAKEVCFSTLNPITGHRTIWFSNKTGQSDFQCYLRYLRRRYRNRELWLLLDSATAHKAARSQALAKELGIVLIWLPKQCPELNAVDHLWRELKRNISANRQFQTITEQSRFAKQWLLSLTKFEALIKAGVLSKNFWLNHFLQNFWQGT